MLLVEDNPSDETLTLRAFRNAGLLNPISVCGTGVHSGPLDRKVGT